MVRPLPAYCQAFVIVQHILKQQYVILYVQSNFIWVLHEGLKYKLWVVIERETFREAYVIC